MAPGNRITKQSYAVQSSLLAATRSLALIAEVNRTLYSEHPLALRLHAFFSLLHTGIPYRDARLTCWFQSAQPGTLRQQFYSPDGWTYPWNDGLTRRVALEGRMARRILTRDAGNSQASNLPVVQFAYLGAPIIWQGRLWGILELRAHNSEELDAATQELIQSILPQLAAVIAEEGMRQQQLPAPTRRQQGLAQAVGDTQQEHLLTALAHELEGPLDLHRLLTLLLRWAIDATGAEAGAINLVDHERGELVLQVHEGYARELFATGLHAELRQRWKWDIGLAGQVAQRGRALLVRDVTREPALRSVAANLRAELAAPIAVDEHVLAVLVLDSPRSGAFGDAELAFVSALCERAAQPLRRALNYQEALETSTQLGQVFTSLPTGLALLDTSGRVLRINPAWTRTWGLPPLNHDETPFHVPLDLIDALLPRLPEPLRLTEFCADEQRTPGEVQTTTVRLINPTQELHVLSVPTQDRHGQTTGRLWAVSDVTREREVDRLKNEFVSIVSHELRTPLTSILGYTELLLARDFAPDDQKQFIKTVYDQATHLSQLVEDLLGVSRLDAGKVKLNRWVIALRQVIAELTNQLNAQLERHRLLIRLDNELPPVFVDRDKVKQILFNLLTNAIKYSPDGGEVELVVEEIRPAQVQTALPPDHPPGRWVVVSVRDQGLGIAPEDLSRIWERFYRVDNTNTRRIGGTGLGLSITRGLVELHGGRIWVDSTVGEGSIFSFTLPVANELERRG
jgi:signal transduction histidine kinase